MTAEPTQLTFLQANLAPNQWPCPTCRGNLVMHRTLHPSEARERGVTHETCRCRSCDGQGTVPFDQTDHSVFPF